MRLPATALLIVLTLLLPALSQAQPIIVDPQVLQQLQETIRQQQQQLQLQAEQIAIQARTLQALQQQVQSMQQTAASPEAVRAAAAPPPLPSPAPVLSSGNDKIKLSLSGQINRAVNITNDGGSTKLYPVDNDASNSRIRLVGTARISDDLTLGTRLELSIAPDESSVVSQNNQAPGDYFNQRWAEVSLASKRFGKLSLGKGDTASNTTAEADLSRTNVVQYAGISDISGGMRFTYKTGGYIPYPGSTDTKDKTLKVSDVFKSGDGLSRQSRLRYDTPTWNGFRLAGSLISNQQSDIALYWGGEGYGFKAEGAVAVANPKITNAGLLYDGSFSLLHSSSGLNLTLAGAILDKEATEDRTNLYVKLGWLTNPVSLGSTAFGVDYTRSEHAARAGDRAWSVGAAMVQAFEKWATEVYFQYRIYALDRADGSAPVANINVGTFGARVKF